jgi:hypothetical protein
MHVLYILSPVRQGIMTVRWSQVSYISNMSYVLHSAGRYDSQMSAGYLEKYTYDVTSASSTERHARLMVERHLVLPHDVTSAKFCHLTTSPLPVLPQVP